MTEELEEIDEQYNTIHPASQFFYLILIVFACLIIGAIASLGIIVALYGFGIVSQLGSFSATSPPEVLNSLKIFQSLSSVFMFLAPPIFFAYLIVHEPKSYLKTNFRFTPLLILLVLIIMFVSSPLMELVVNFNQQMVFPDFLKGLYKWMRDSEDEAARVTAIFLKMNGPKDLIINLVMIGILPALAEEFLFRGAIQTIFTRWTKNPHWGIWIAAILFSAMHMQFFGFLPRLMLGVAFGYFVWWSGSIWTSVWAHFLNNGTAVVVTYLFQQKLIKLNPDDQHVFNYAGYAFSLIITVLLFTLYRKLTLQQKTIPLE
jgi:membrane protease YdiL (CAAX protease family)